MSHFLAHVLAFFGLQKIPPRERVFRDLGLHEILETRKRMREGGVLTERDVQYLTRRKENQIHMRKAMAEKIVAETETRRLALEEKQLRWAADRAECQQISDEIMSTGTCVYEEIVPSEPWPEPRGNA